jgi:serine carboxypeptidase-like clade 2
VLIYSGDNDAIVPTTGTRRWVEYLGRTIVNDTHQWWVDTNGAQVGGWATEYDRMTFTTVRGAGHMVPYMQPHRALHMFSTFLEKKKL